MGIREGGILLVMEGVWGAIPGWLSLWWMLGRLFLTGGVLVVCVGSIWVSA